MKFTELLLCISTDTILLLNIILFADIFNKHTSKTSLIKIITHLIIFISYSILFYSFYFENDNKILDIITFLIFYVRYPLIVFSLMKTPLKNALYIFFLISQLCDLIQLLIYNFGVTILGFSDIIYKYLISNITRALLMILLIIFHKFGKNYKIKTVIRLLPTKVYILSIFNISAINLLINVINYNTSNNDMKNTLFSILPLLIVSLSLAITVLLISNCISKTYYNSVNSILEKQIENQIEHYNQNEILNSDLRHFKHDYTNHMLCLKSMINSNQNNEALIYIEKINSEISLSAKTFNTGHKIADAILNEKCRIHSDINIKFDGHIPDFFDNVDLCIVLGNAVDNALEACEKLDDANKIIDIIANVQQSHFILIIKNTVEKDLKINGNFPETTKSDPIRHGFGLSNIKRIVDKYDGDMSVEADNGIFTLYMALKVN